MEGSGQIVRKWRTTRGLSQQALAVAVGMSAAAVTQWERDVVVPKRETAAKLDEALDAGGEVLAAFGYSVPVDPDQRISQLEGEVADLRRQLIELARVVRDLGERALLPDADESLRPDESRTAR